MMHTIRYIMVFDRFADIRADSALLDSLPGYKCVYLIAYYNNTGNQVAFSVKITEDELCFNVTLNSSSASHD